MSDRNELDRAGSSNSGWTDARDPASPIWVPDAVRDAFAELEGPLAVRSLSGGLLHQSFHVRNGDVEYVLQRVSDAFAPEIHANIEAVTTHLAARGVRTTRLLHTRTGALYVELEDLGRWRLMEHLGGASFERLQSTAQAHSAGVIVGRFAQAMSDFDAPLAPMGMPYRDTPRYLAALEAAVDAHATHRLAPVMVPLAERIFEAFDRLGPAPVVPDRVIHGDLKLSNLLFESATGPGRERAFALVDLDTLMRAPLWVELGDAWRSWCNLLGEDEARPRFDLRAFAASFQGFEKGLASEDGPLPAQSLSEQERLSLRRAPERITLELCTRFVTDAFEEVYWGWDAQRFPTRGDHNAFRAQAQWQLFEVMRGVAKEREAILLGRRS